METQHIGYVPSNYVVIDDGKLQSQEYAFTVQKCLELATSRTAPRALFVRISKFRGVRIAIVYSFFCESIHSVGGFLVDLIVLSNCVAFAHAMCPHY